MTGRTDAVQAAAQVRVVRGTPDDIEVAALVAGLAAVSSSDADERTVTGPDTWIRRARAPRGTLPTVGDDAWRWSLRG
ncbi:acyl-CoA carboxylase epsilon subunit [Sanguibacter suaedae]|uniref:Acyl-CoA carboxylase subunit epsilon n=1 Tax=Sanguibacter suaedae TaxID=2795737 RepID=A0A934I6I3_9MICO|nr:acyl-CoA carboxylase epsilon subunit [Sanguibacter suaedae]MBI9115141.1 hypothetical protein [Sanguibacter suaedae]